MNCLQFQNLLTRVLDNLDACMEKAVSKEMSENIGKCFQLATGLPCSSAEHVSLLAMINKTAETKGNVQKPQEVCKSMLGFRIHTPVVF